MKVHIKIYRQSIDVEVSVVVGEYLDWAGYITGNRFMSNATIGTGASLTNTSLSSRSYYKTPEEWLCWKETLYEIMAALESCTAV